MKEEHLLTGPLEPTNRPYALGQDRRRRDVLELQPAVRVRNTSPSCPPTCTAPATTTIRRTSHVHPGPDPQVPRGQGGQCRDGHVWGTGTPKREFLYSDDMADACACT